MQTYNSIKGARPYSLNYMSEYGIYDGMNGNFSVKREYTEEELDGIARKLSAFHTAPIRLYRQWFCDITCCWRLVFEYDKL